MKDLLTNLFLAGFGAMMLTKEKAEEMVGELVHKGEVNRDDAKHVVDSLVEKGKKEQSNLVELIRGEVRKVIEDMGVTSREEFEELKKKIAALEEKAR